MSSASLQSACPAYADEVTEPIDSLELLLEWDESSVGRCLVGRPLDNAVEQFDAKARPRTLVCHDMAGGYLEDRFAHGCVADTVYYLREWPYMDIFVYFSHHLVTIPPVCWIDAAHTHNVPVLGTFISEWGLGEKICNEFLSDGKKLIAVAEQLARIAEKYKFEGWLLNIENPVKDVANLRSFAGLLTTKCKEIIGPRALVIWYDSVTADGQLQWQNALNEQNKCYFDVCDGIFLNYNWNDKLLETTVAQAGDRLLDVYVGIDVFGRGVLGGGGFNCIEALSAIRKYDLSAAIFGPGWVYETLNKMEFENNQRKFWSLMITGLRCNEIVRLPFCTNFVPGKRWYPPKVDEIGNIVERCYVALRDQELQPHWFCPHDSDGDESKARTLQSTGAYFVHDYAAGQPGGYALEVVITERNNRLRLFCCNFVADRPVRIMFTHRTNTAIAQIGIAIKTCKKNTSTTYIIPDTLDKERTASTFDPNTRLTYCSTVVTSVQPLGEMMISDLAASEEALQEIDVLIFANTTLPIDCIIASFALSYVE